MEMLDGECSWAMDAASLPELAKAIDESDTERSSITVYDLDTEEGYVVSGRVTTFLRFGGAPYVEVVPRFTGDEIATLLHGLRLAQEQATDRANREDSCSQKGSSCDHFDGWNPLSPEQIDQLAERLNPLSATR
jgi:hypothetical protein